MHQKESIRSKAVCAYLTLKVIIIFSLKVKKMRPRGGGVSHEKRLRQGGIIIPPPPLLNVRHYVYT